MSPESLAVAALFIPLAGAAAVALLGRWPNAREAASLIAGGALLVVVVALLEDVLGGARPEAILATVIQVPGDPSPILTLAFKIEPLGMIFALVASGLWIVTTVYSVGYMRAHHEKNQTRFYACFAVAIACAIGVAFAANLFTLFVFYEAMTLSTYPLVTHHGTHAAKRAGRVYLGILMTTSVGFLLLAMAWTYAVAGTLDFTPGGILNAPINDGRITEGLAGVLLALYVFGVGKAAVMPFHRWLPNAMVAPTPVSALLHAVAVVKAGVFSVMKISVYVFGTDLLATLTAADILAYVAGATILVASLIALRQDNLKARLAYSTISQLSYIVLGALLADEMGWGVVGGSMHIATHALGKITLFFCAGAIYVAAHKTDVSQLDGIGRRMPVTLFAFLIGSLSVIGLPPFGGMWSKWYLALGAVKSGHLVLLGVLMVSSLLNVAYLLPIVVRGFFRPPKDDGHGDAAGGVREAPLLCVVPLCVTAAGCLALFFFGHELYALIEPITGAGG